MGIARSEVVVKVVGTGTPEVAQVRFEACEADVLRAELAQLHASLVGHEDQLIERRAVEAFIEITDGRALDASVELEGPFDMMRELVWSGLGRVSAELQRAVAGARISSVDTVLRSAATAHAWAQTVADLDYVENRGLYEAAMSGAWHDGD
jgi:hypothetical protein